MLLHSFGGSSSSLADVAHTARAAASASRASRSRAKTRCNRPRCSKTATCAASRLNRPFVTSWPYLARGPGVRAVRAVESAARTAFRIAATVRRARRVLSWTAGCPLRARVGGARDQTGAGAFFCYGGFHRALQASALECREAVIEWAAFAYQAVSEAARVRSTALNGAPRPLWMLVLGLGNRRKCRSSRSPVSRRPRRTRCLGFWCSLPYKKRVSLALQAEAQSWLSSMGGACPRRS